MMRASGAADSGGRRHRALARRPRAAGARRWSALPLFVVGMFVGLAGVAVLSAGVFAVPALRRIGFDDATIAAFIAVMATAGMIAPPMNVPAMLIADGVNMPWTNVDRARCSRCRCRWRRGARLVRAGDCGARPAADDPHSAKAVELGGDACAGFAPLLVIVAIWIVGARILGDRLVDPASPLILVDRRPRGAADAAAGEKSRKVVMATFTGTPLLLAAVLVTVGVLVQIMTLTGVRGWLVISTMSLQRALELSRAC